MASPMIYLNGLRVAVMVLIFSLTFPPSKPEIGKTDTGGVGFSLSGYDDKNVKVRKQVLGSRPPQCVGKCLNCKPCMATLVIPPHQRSGERISSHEEDGSYYLLSWKCKCGDKLFQP